MTEPLSFQVERDPSVDQQSERPVAFASPDFDVSPFQTLDTSGKELTTKSPNYVRLDLQHLECFEIVDQQYEQMGVTFTNAIALNPSNPAFPATQGQTVLLGAPKSGWLEATFTQPVQFVGSLVTSSRRTVLMGFDDENQLVAKAETPGPNLAGSNSPTPPNAELNLVAQNIRRITFSSLGGQLALGEFSFGV